MSRRQTVLACVVIFNVLMITGFVFSNFFMWDFLKTEIDEKQGYNGEGLYVIPYIEDIGFQVSISHLVWQNGTVVNLGPLPSVVPNYPFILFWGYVIGNLFLMAFALNSWKSDTRKEYEENT